MRRRASLRWTGLIVVAAVALAIVGNAQAVQIKGSDSNTTAGSIQAEYPSFSYFDHVGRYSGGSAVYLGEQWVLTAAHVPGVIGGQVNAPTNFIVNSTTYNADLSVDPVRLLNPDNSATDLVMYRLLAEVTPGLLGMSGPTIASATPSIGDEIIMIGQGRDREASLTGWDSGWNETNAPGQQAYTGYYYASPSTRTKRWGVNEINGVHGYNGGVIDPDDSNNPYYNDANIYDNGYGPILSFSSNFSENGSDFEAQAAPGDSGGAVFIDNNGVWELAGIFQGISRYADQPDASVFGNQAFMMDLSLYRDQIAQTLLIPEPATVLLLLSCAPLLFRRRLAA